MAKTRIVFFCTDCGNESPRWAGKCPACSAWNTMVEQPSTPRARTRESGSGRPEPSRQSSPLRLRDVEGKGSERWSAGFPELDFVLGGGVVPGSLVLLGGEPGIGKSTLLLQAAGLLERAGRVALYVSGEESGAQVRMRADRLAGGAAEVTFLAETDLQRILAETDRLEPAILIIDSIQTIYSPDFDGAPGNLGQVRECAARLQRFAKDRGVAVFLVGHVTKGGDVAGPKTLEHIVDTVLYFEAAQGVDHRILRATKNRFGAADEIGVFRMTETGLQPVTNPSELFLRERSRNVSGSAVVAIMEGSRPLLVEVQALCSKSSYGAPQRVSTGFDRQRLTLLLAVLEKRAGIEFGQLDVFLNLVGGVRLSEPAGDLAVVASLVSSAFDRPTPARTIFIGEVGLGGELRPASRAERRLGEAARMGFERACLAQNAVPRRVPPEIEVVPLRDIAELVRHAFP